MSNDGFAWMDEWPRRPAKARRPRSVSSEPTTAQLRARIRQLEAKLDAFTVHAPWRDPPRLQLRTWPEPRLLVRTVMDRLSSKLRQGLRGLVMRALAGRLAPR